ncbi:hypothetical protein CLAIMM_02381 [Cladophialophora immunda]|nr:hypothetical protein CLAIMM_02381 [Cladophialophora immunda]
MNADGTIPILPATIEDALSLTAMLGKRYLWVDSICIDQTDEEEKKRQIPFMADIYRGAYATILSLCGSSADDGLTRVGSRRAPQPQLSFHVDKQRLVGLMPTLSRQIAYTVWGTRAWTLQEALLSPRCIYITDHQAYFECNAMQCSESIDVTRSWIHNSARDLETMRDNREGSKHGHGTLRNTTLGLGRPQDPMMAYGTLIALYSYRFMTYQSDAINAFAAILQHLTEFVFDHGFYYGLPEDDLNWSLLWCGQDQLQRRPGFPAWSWAGWEGAIHPGWPSEVSGPTQPFWTHFHAWKLHDGHPKLAFPHHTKMSQENVFTVETAFDMDPVPVLDHDLLQQALASDHRDSCLLLDCMVWRTSIELLDHVPGYDYGPFRYFAIRLNRVRCLVRAPVPWTSSTDVGRHVPGSGEPATFILTGRDTCYIEGTTWVVHHFLHANITSDREAVRRGVMHLLVPKSRPRALDGVVVRRMSLVLI